MAGESPSSPIVRELGDGGVEVTVPTQRRNWNVMLRNARGSSRGRIVQYDSTMSPSVVIWLVLYLLFASRKPRAHVRIDRRTVSIECRGEGGFGWPAQTIERPREQVTELRRHQFISAMHLRIAGKEECDVLTGLPPDVLETVIAAVEAAMTRTSPTITTPA